MNQSVLNREVLRATESLKNFQKMENAEYMKGLPWPMMYQHKEIESKIEIAFDCLDEVSKLGKVIDVEKPLDPKVVSLLRAMVRSTEDINGKVGASAPANIRKQMNKVMEDFNRVFKLFPITGKEFEPR
jgi:hypothetical protein